MSLASRVLKFTPLATVLAVTIAHTSTLLHGQASAATGGIIDSATSVGLRPGFSAAQMQTFLPSRGVFTFPAPYSTQGIRITNAGDCGGADCVMPVGYSYWSNINNHASSETMLIFLGLHRQKGGGGPTLFSYNKRTGDTQNLGPLFPSSSPYSWSTGEGWYFSATNPNMLYLNDGPRMLRYDVQSHGLSTVFDVTNQIGPNKYIWQMHSSNDDRVHSATLRDGATYEMLGCVVHSEATGRTTFYARQGDFDECQIDRSGRWLVVKENVDHANGEDNRIIDLQSGTEQLLTDPNGAAGHSDIGFGFMVAEDNYNNEPGAVRLWDFSLDMRGGQPATAQGQGTLVYKLTSWSSGIGHLAFGGAFNGLVSRQRACASNASRQQLPRVNEIVCFPLDGSLEALIVAPNLTDLDAAGGGSQDYDKLPKGNMDPTGEYFIWTGNAGTNRLDAFVVRIPLPTTPVLPAPPPSSPPSPPAPTPTPVPGPSAPAPPSPSTSAVPVNWTNAVNVTASNGELRKSAGCGGCADAGASSTQRITSGSGGVSFTTSDVQTLRVIGLGPGGAGTSANEITFALRLQNGAAEVREAGVYKSEVAFAAGDQLMIAIVAGAVQYSKNGAVFYTSAAAPTYPLAVDTSLYDLNATLSSVTISTTASAATSMAAGGNAAPAATSTTPSSRRTATPARSPRRRG